MIAEPVTLAYRLEPGNLANNFNKKYCKGLYGFLQDFDFETTKISLDTNLDRNLILALAEDCADKFIETFKHNLIKDLHYISSVTDHAEFFSVLRSFLFCHGTDDYCTYIAKKLRPLNEYQDREELVMHLFVNSYVWNWGYLEEALAKGIDDYKDELSVFYDEFHDIIKNNLYYNKLS